MTSAQPFNHTPDASGWSAALYNKNANFVYSPAFTSPVLDLLAAKPGERIIDFGCGRGELTLVIEKIVKEKEGGYVAAVDLSESMVRVFEWSWRTECELCMLNDTLPTD